MNERFLHPRLNSESTREARMCYVQGIGDTFEKGGQYLNAGAEALSNVAGNVAGWFANRNVDLVKNVPIQFAEGLIDAWNRETNTPELEKNGKLRTVAEFARTTPAMIQEIITKNFDQQKPTLSQLNVLMNQENWIDMFMKSESFDEGVNPQVPLSLLKGPQGIFFSLDANDRKELYYQFVAVLLGPEVLDNPAYSQYFGASVRPGTTNVPTTSAERVATMLHPTSAPVLNNAMKIALGISEASTFQGTQSFNIAKESLMHHYWNRSTRPPNATVANTPSLTPGVTTVSTARSVSPQFKADMARATRGRVLLPNLDAVRNGIGEPSRLRGALDPSLGIFLENDIGDIQSLMSQHVVERQLGLQKSVIERRQYSDSLKNEKQRSAETIGETLMNLGGLEKLALAFITYQVFKSKAIRNVAGGLGLLYFGQKFLLKQEDPLNEIWKPTIMGITKNIKDNSYVSAAFKKLNVKFEDKKYTDAEIQSRLGVAEQFLSENLHRRMDASLTGFSLLGDMKLSDLANYVSITSDGTQAVLHSEDRNFQKIAGEKLSRHGDRKNAANDFFNGGETKTIDPKASKELRVEKITEHMSDAGNALASVYYMITARRPEYKESMAIVEHFRGMTLDGKYTDLPSGFHKFDYNKDGRPELVNPRAVYTQMVRAGMLKGYDEHMTLFEFMQGELRINDNPYEQKKTQTIVTPPGVAAGGGNATANTPPNTPAPSSTTKVTTKKVNTGPTDDPTLVSGPSDAVTHVTATNDVTTGAVAATPDASTGSGSADTPKSLGGAGDTFSGLSGSTDFSKTKIEPLDSTKAGSSSGDELIDSKKTAENPKDKATILDSLKEGEGSSDFLKNSSEGNENQKKVQGSDKDSSMKTSTLDDAQSPTSTTENLKSKIGNSDFPQNSTNENEVKAKVGSTGEKKNAAQNTDKPERNTGPAVGFKNKESAN